MRYIYGLIGFSIYVFIPNFFQFLLMTKIEDEITNNIREDVFSKLMLMPTEWYDRSEN